VGIWTRTISRVGALWWIVCLLAGCTLAGPGLAGVSTPLPATGSATFTPAATAFVLTSPLLTPLAEPTWSVPTAAVVITTAITPSVTATSAPTVTAALADPPNAVHVPILMYHYISAPPAGANAIRRDLSVSPDRFESHLRYLQEHGYHAITLDDLHAALTEGRALPDKPVILTFDDGYVDNYTNAFPLLKKYGVVGEFFLITDFVDSQNPAYMSWGQVEEMGQAGQRFGSHSRNHPDLRRKTVDYLVWQALGGIEDIQRHLGYHPRWIAYPSGQYDANVIAVYKSAGYWGGLTTSQGATHTLAGIFELKRVRIHGATTAAGLEALLALKW
jgi:peptidoglycan/xylan/chitin deacetylase (PgdA/CDA1 family)